MKKVLVIEGHAQPRNILLQGLEAGGFCAIAAEDGAVGIQRAREQSPDVITCGVLLPPCDGHTVLKTLRQDPPTAVIPFIFVTTQSTWADYRKAMELGANDYLIKPCTLEEILQAIKAQLEKQALLQQWFTQQRLPIPSLAETKATVCASTLELNYPSVPQLQEVFQFIEANYQRSITLSDVAQTVGYSSSYLTSLIGRQTGKTVQRWIIDRRMAAARQLLLETDQIVEQIAAQVGYQSSVHFFRQFRRVHGMTPQVWRSSHRNPHSNTRIIARRSL